MPVDALYRQSDLLKLTCGIVEAFDGSAPPPNIVQHLGKILLKIWRIRYVGDETVQGSVIVNRQRITSVPEKAMKGKALSHTVE